MLDRRITFGKSSEECRVLVRRGVANDLGSILLASGCESVYFITDRNVERLCKSFFTRKLKSIPIESHLMTLPAGEKTKNLRTQLLVQEWLLKNGAVRASLVVGVGGGVVCDIAGFAAATFMRGISHAFVPTTLVAQVDAAIGGKNGVNLPLAKNIVGTIKQPRAVIVDPSFLDTLPAAQLKEGISELLKIALVRSKQLGEELHGLLSSDNPEERTQRLGRSAEIGVKLKLDIVRKDPFEKGLRMILNFGHTTAHALEAFGRFGRTMPHGKAVALGMLVALDLSRNICELDDDTVAWANAQIRLLYRSFPVGDVKPEELWMVAKHDKKRTRGQANFVLLEAYARPVVRSVSRRQFISSFADVREKWSDGR